jgi:hypothetical protein
MNMMPEYCGGFFGVDSGKLKNFRFYLEIGAGSKTILDGVIAFLELEERWCGEELN